MNRRRFLQGLVGAPAATALVLAEPSAGVVEVVEDAAEPESVVWTANGGDIKDLVFWASGTDLDLDQDLYSIALVNNDIFRIT